MKLNKLIFGVVFAVMIIAAGTGCRKQQFNINQNVNSPTDSTITFDAVLPAAMNATASIIARQWGPIQNWMSFWARSGTYAPNVIEETYQITTGFGNGVWNACYDNAYDYQIVAIKSRAAGAGFYEGIARIMKTIDFQILVDVYGDVPYSQALKGSGNPTPAYDKGVDIYNGLMDEIDAGMGLISSAVVSASTPNKSIATHDIMFQGNKTAWLRFGNTLKLRLLIHAYNVAGINRTARLNAINAEGSGFLQPGQDAQINPGYTGIDKPNPFFNQYKTNTDGSGSANDVYYKANEWGIEYYKYNGDPRVTSTVVPGTGGRIYSAGSGGFVGVAYGLPPISANAAAVLAGIGPGIYKTVTSPQCILSASETYFLLAEARQRGWALPAAYMSLTPEQLLRTAIEQNFSYLGVPNAVSAVASYISFNAPYPDVDINGVAQGPGGPAGGLYTILSQKWFAMNGIATLEVWTDWRRVAYTEVATNILQTTAANDAPSTNFVYGDGAGYTGGPNSRGIGPFRSVSPLITSSDNIPVRYLYPQTEYNYNAGNVPGGITRFSKIFWDTN
ncbi:MAG TPA: SusD/RagB family nutrient-binding outer membrane lipoprotein [Chitinophagaceae bacterium]|nr:SusD/RagB family nutrient-binding outer membrane lipoprotein [Chitinophagaceae bacterium]